MLHRNVAMLHLAREQALERHGRKIDDRIYVETSGGAWAPAGRLVSASSARFRNTGSVSKSAASNWWTPGGVLPRTRTNSSSRTWDARLGRTRSGMMVSLARSGEPGGQWDEPAIRDRSIARSSLGRN